MGEAFVRKYINNMVTYAVRKTRGQDVGIALDIGANHGAYTTLIADRFEHVYAFEPHPDNIIILKKNATSKNITIIQKALSDKTCKGKLFTSKSNPGGHSISPAVADKKTWGHDSGRFIDVDFITLDDFVKETNITNLEFLKVDIEGAEVFVFNGAINTLKNMQLDIMIETHLSYDVMKLYKFFADLGYKWYDHEMNEIKTIKNNNHYLISNSDREIEW